MKRPLWIDEETKDGLFKWILESEDHATSSENNSAMIRELVIRYNEIINYIHFYDL